MQPMISPIDHESRNGGGSGGMDDDTGVPTESTPLLSRFPSTAAAGHRDTATSVTVGLLLIILISGIVIGTYLLVEQGKEENVLPPVEQALQLVSRSQWDPQQNSTLPAATLRMSGARTAAVVAVQTDTAPCHRLHECADVLRELQRNGTAKWYNFAISSHGRTYECLGWRTRSSHFDNVAPSTLVVAFIGNFTEEPPSPAQVEEAKRFFDESVSQRYLQADYTIIGKHTVYKATHLFRKLSSMPQWNKELSDS